MILKVKNITGTHYNADYRWELWINDEIVRAGEVRLTAEAASKQDTIDMLLEDERDAFRHERAQLETQLAKARAEVERLRLPAEAWEAREAMLDEEKRGTIDEQYYATNKYAVAADKARIAARAAKETQP